MIIAKFEITIDANINFHSDMFSYKFISIEKKIQLTIKALRLLSIDLILIQTT
jgi:hypothetical protein